MPAELASMILTTLLAAATVPADIPEPDLLEFLGGFETADGHSVPGCAGVHGFR